MYGPLGGVLPRGPGECGRHVCRWLQNQLLLASDFLDKAPSEWSSQKPPMVQLVPSLTCEQSHPLTWLGGVRRWHLVVQQRVGGWHHAGRPRVLMHLLRGLPVLLLHLLSSPQLSVFQLLHVEVLTFRE